MNHRSQVQRVVVKLGGSLLTEADFPQRLHRLIHRCFRDCQVLLVIGGGQVIDALREFDRVHKIDAASIHWLCIDALQTTFQMVSLLLSPMKRIQTRDELKRQCEAGEPGVSLVSIAAFYDRNDDDVLPCDWSTTSDSLAALLAKRAGCDQLYLLKSCEVATGMTLSEAAASGLVDEALPSIASGLQVTMLRLPE